MTDVLDINEQLQKMINTTTDGGVIVTGMKAAEEILRLRAENAQLVEQLFIRSESGMAKDMQEIMTINNALLAENEEIKANFMQSVETELERHRPMLERLRAENKRLRAALKPIAEYKDYLDKYVDYVAVQVRRSQILAAAAALKETE